MSYHILPAVALVETRLALNLGGDDVGTAKEEPRTQHLYVMVMVSSCVR